MNQVYLADYYTSSSNGGSVAPPKVELQLDQKDAEMTEHRRTSRGARQQMSGDEYTVGYNIKYLMHSDTAVWLVEVDNPVREKTKPGLIQRIRNAFY